MSELINVADLKRLAELDDNIKILSRLITEKVSICEKIDKQIYYVFMADYHFNQKVKKVTTLNDLITVEYFDKNIVYPNDIIMWKQLSNYSVEQYELKKIRAERLIYYNSYCDLNEKMLQKISEIMKSYDDLYKKERLRRTYTSIFGTANDKSRNTKNPSSGEATVMKVLDKLAKKYKFIYFFRHRMSLCRDKLPLEYDFYCVMFENGKLIQWVIEFDGDQHEEKNDIFDFEKNHQHDILKQYYLAEMNIHLLRLNNNNNTATNIVKFIKEILITDKYIIKNKIEPILKLFKDKTEHDGLKNFHKIHNTVGNFVINDKDVVIDEWDDDDMKKIKQLNKKSKHEFYSKKIYFDSEGYVDFKKYENMSSLKQENSEFIRILNKRLKKSEAFMMEDEKIHDDNLSITEDEIAEILKEDLSDVECDEQEIDKIIEETDKEEEKKIMKESIKPNYYSDIMEFMKMISDYNKERLRKSIKKEVVEV